MYPSHTIICCLLTTVTAVFFALQSKKAEQWLLARQQRHVRSFHRQMFGNTDLVQLLTLHYRSITSEAEND